MPLRAKISRVYLARLGIVAAFLLGYALWFLFDGLVSYPNQRERGLAYLDAEEYAYREVKGVSADYELDESWKKTVDEQWDRDTRAEWNKIVKDRWAKVAAEHNWPPQNPGPPKTEGDIKGQFAMVALVAPFGLVFLFVIVRNWGRWFELDGRKISSSRGDDFTLDQIVELNKRKWRKKGIAYLYYEDGGRRRKLTLDDCNFERKPTTHILRHIEDNISHDLITKGPPEPPPADESQQPETEEVHEDAVEHEAS